MSEINRISLNGQNYDLAPTIQTGSNYMIMKFPNGVMIIAGTKVYGTINVSTAWGSLYETSSLIDLGDYPTAFVSTPNLQITPIDDNGIFFEVIKERTSTKLGKTWFCKPTAASVEVSINYLAIGRWK